MIKKGKHRIRATGKTIRLHPKSRKLIANSVIRAIRTMNIQQTEVRNNPTIQRTVEYKKIRILMVSSLSEVLWQTEQLIAEHFRHLVKELVSIKAFQSFSTALAQLNPDLLLVVGCDEPFADADLDIIRNTTAAKVIWLSDGAATNETTGRLAGLFDFVFTQNALHLSFYQHSGCNQVMVLPFAADRSLFFPKYAENNHRSEILLLGDLLPGSREYIREISPLLEGLNVYAAGTGWESYPDIRPVPPDEELPDLYNGAEMIIHWGQPPGRVFDIAACGAFQLAEAHPNYYEYLNPGEDIAIFHSGAELREKLHYYRNHPEAKRALASRALWKSTYDYSFLQMAAKLLHTVFNR